MKQPMLLTLVIIFYMHIAYCQPVIKIFGSQDPLKVNKQVTEYLAHLNVQEKIYLSVIFTAHLPEKLKGITICQHLSGPKNYQVIKVRIDARLSKKQQALVLAHEMIHVKQYAKGELKVISEQQVLWEGRKYYYQRNARQRIPWENEAYQNDNLLAKLYKEQPEAPLTASRIKP